ncbi:MAG TPA: VanZ family protein [Mobilitalea sp.]|nr:VanZ family protein [Mobilitalea sp.]
MKNRNVWCWLPAALLATLIFVLSSENGHTSYGLSMQIILSLKKFVEWVKKEPIYVSIDAIWLFTMLLRKLAHVMEYALLAIAILIPLNCYHIRRSISIMISFGICLTYSCFDELHQIFIVDRTAKVTDVFIDCAGIMMGIALFALAYQWRKIKNQACMLK